MDQSSNSTYSTEASNNSTTTPSIEVQEESYIIGITILVFLSLFVICIVALCIRAINKAKKIRNKQKKALLKRDSMSKVFVQGANHYSNQANYNVGFIDPNAYPFIPPQNYAYPSAFSINH